VQYVNDNEGMDTSETPPEAMPVGAPPQPPVAGAVRRAEGLPGRTIVWIVCGCVFGLLVLLGIAAAILLPSLHTARHKAFRAHCINNMHQIHLALQIYRSDMGDYPPWLSNLKKYVRVQKVFQCLSDPSRGRQGSKPPWRLPGETKDTRYAETWDFAGAAPAAKAAGCMGEIDTDASALQDPWLQGNSYLYEFCAARCSWWKGEMYADPHQPGRFHEASNARVDLNRDGKISWREAREFELNTLGPWTPMVSCYWHSRERPHQVIRVSAGHGTVYASDATKDGWKKVHD